MAQGYSTSEYSIHSQATTTFPSIFHMRLDQVAPLASTAQSTFFSMDLDIDG